MLIDTSGWFCIFDTTQPGHSLATSLYEGSRRRLTHSYVIAEFVALAQARKMLRSDMLRFLKYILKDTEISLIWVDEPTTVNAIDLLDRRADKTWSLCDAVSFVLMDELGLTDALTTDHHFEQAGFVRLLSS